MDYQEKAKSLGYEVDVAFVDGEGKKSYRVQGFGVDTVYVEDQDDSWKFLTNDKAHEHRVNMMKHNDDKDDFTMTDEEITNSSLDASVSVGLLTEEQAQEQRKVVLNKE